MRKERKQLNKWHLMTGENTDHENAEAVEPSHVTGVVEQNYAKAKSTLDRIARTMKELREK